MSTELILLGVGHWLDFFSKFPVCITLATCIFGQTIHKTGNKVGVYNNILCIHSTITVLGKRFLATLAVYATSLNSISLRNSMLLPKELKQ